MEIISFDQGIIRLCETYCKHHGKYGVYISFQEPDFMQSKEVIEEYIKELVQACPVLKNNDDNYNHEINDVIFGGGGLLLFDSYELQQAAYWSIVGDDGPTKLNSYDGVMRVYALTINKFGQTENENT